MAKKKKNVDYISRADYEQAGIKKGLSNSSVDYISQSDYDNTGIQKVLNDKNRYIAPVTKTTSQEQENNTQKSFSFNINNKYDSQYKSTGKKIGDYIKDSSLKDSEIFQKDNKFYYYDSKKKQYNEITNKTGYDVKENKNTKKTKQIAPISEHFTNKKQTEVKTGKFEEPTQTVKAREDKLGLADRLNVEFSGKSDKDKKKMESELVQKEKDNARLAGVANGLKDKGYVKAGAFDDGYQFGDLTKTILSTGGDVITNVTKGIFSVGEGIGDTINYGIAGVADWLGKDDFADVLREETSKSITDAIFNPASETYNKNSVLGEKGQGLAQGVGNALSMVATGGTGSVGKASAKVLATSFASSFGNGMSEAYQGGATDEEAQTYGLISAIADAGTEMMFGGLGKGSKALGISKSAIPVDDVLARTVSSKFKSKLAQNLTTAMIKSSGEGIEEVASGILQGIGKKMTFESDKELSDILKDEQLLDQFIGGAVASGIMQSPGLVKSTKQGRNMTTGYTDNEQKVVDNVTDSRFNEQIKDNPNMSQKEQNNLRNTIEETVKKDLDEGNLTPKEINNALGSEDYQSYTSEIKRKQKLESQLKELQSKSATDMNYSEYNENNQKIADLQSQIDSINLADLKSKADMPVENRIQDNDYLLQRSYTNYQNNQAQKNMAFEYKPQTDSKGKEVKISDLEKNVYDSASKTMNNTKESHSLADFTAKLSKDTGVQYEFTTTEDLKARGYEVKDSIINGLNTDDGKVLINVDSDSVINRVVGHETTHLFENTEDYKTLQNELFEYAKTKGDFDKLKAELTETYKNVKGANIDNELTSELAGQYIFSDTEFVQNLSKHRNIFQKVYDEIKHLYKIATAGSKEARQLEKVKRTFEKVYQNNEAKVGDTAKFSIQTDKNGNKYVKVDTDQDIFKGKSLSEQNKIAKKYILNAFRENGILLNDEKINVTSRTANEYTHPKRELNKSDMSAKLKASTELDNLLKISEYQYSRADDGRHGIAKDGWDYYQTIFKVDNNFFEGLINIAKNGDNKTLYDITKIKKTSLVGLDDKTSSTARATSFSKNNVSQLNNNVKSDTSNKQYAPVFKNNTKYSLNNDNLVTLQKGEIQSQEVKNENRPIAPLPTNIKTNSQKAKVQNNAKVATPTNNIQENTQETTPTNKTLNPTEIAQIKPENASTTPKIGNIKVSTGNGQSHFFDNIKDKVNMLSEDSKAKILSNDEVKYYKEVTNEDSLNKAFTKLAENGEVETRAWFNKASEKATDVDVAEGWILMKQYEDVKDYDGMVQVAKKMREIGTKAGQTVQAFNIMNRMTPEGMVKYAQSELSEVYEQMIKGKTKKWIDQHRNDFELKPEEVKFIMDNMQEVATMKDGYDKKVKLAEIQKLMTDKIPPAKGQGVKAWMRISMLFNPKTQVRNVAGNALIAPVNAFGDLFASGVDKLVSRKTGVRTVGTTNLKNYTKGMRKGLFESYNDFKKGINTRNIDGNRFEIGEGKSFNDNTRIGKSLNRVDSLLSFMLDAGDRMFYEGSFVNSINNQMILNNTDVVTQEMIDIATQEALSRTWQDNNNYTRFVLSVRRMLNHANIKGYGLGDVLIPFAKTPANLTKALVDYSPAGLVSTLIKGNNLKNAINTGQYTAQMQHDFAQSLGKATAGTMLYVLGYALAKAGILSGESDDDKDVSNFMKNTMGVNSYSIKIGNKSFTYDWAQPLAGPFSMMANLVNKQDQEASLGEKITSSLDTAGNIILEQSFMESINTVLSNNDGVATGIEEAILDLPARAIPTFMKQITDMVDGTQRVSFEYDKPLQSSINSIKAKIPGLSQTLAPSVDSLGREIQKYGGKNNIFNVFFNPANVANENVSESAKEIYRVYKQTGDSTILPRVAPYYVNNNGEKIVLDSKKREQLQKKSGQLLEKSLDNMMKTDTYINANDEDKAEMINGLVNYSYNIAQHEVVGTELSQTYEKAYNFTSNGGNIENYYIYKFNTKDMGSNEKERYLYNSNFSNEQKTLLYENITLSDFSDESKYLNYKTSKLLGIDINNWLDYSSQDFKSDIAPTGKTISGSKKNKLISFVNSLNLSIPQKASLIKMSYSSYDNYDNQIMSEVNSLNISFMDKAKMVKTLGFDEYDKSIINYVDKNYLSMSEKTSALKDLGFTVYTYKGRMYVR